ncbi:hypothetical protein A0J48_019425 [Sphaerospermopsis aphanizomenoides BCCUSP55]|uniref:DUF6335 family protein n=1 Tax=Sphaerospermopsis aphanizomenoides TaxID=459663 RepID=UPI0019052944|nr:DUF6335 family protein [Sphaerospermopsis aphanizomenoides]MBK1989678.1 hypothetical protein [Sphaerospermopsis aphanizomenoides BCCUSP55]
MTKTQQQNEDKSDDLLQNITESYGTGVKDLPGYNVGSLSLREDRQEYTESSPEFPAEFTITDNGLDAYWQETVGDEAVGGTVATPEKNVIEELGIAVGLEMNDYNFLHTNEILEHRDDARWELDPKSSEDYQERRE